MFSDKDFDEWLDSPAGRAWEVGVYEMGFDEGWENARAIMGGLDIPDEEIPTMSDDALWRMFQKNECE